MVDVDGHSHQVYDSAYTYIPIDISMYISIYYIIYILYYILHIPRYSYGL